MNELFEDIVAPYTPLMRVLHSATPSDSTGVSTKGDFVKKLTNPDSLQTLLDGDLLTLKKQINALISMIEVNTSAVHANTIATDNLALAIIANTAALAVANSANFVREIA